MMKFTTKTATCLSIALLCMVFSHCEDSNKVVPETSINLTDLPQSIKTAHAIPLDSLQLAMNEVAAAVSIAQSGSELLALENQQYKYQKSSQAILNQLKQNTSLDHSNHSKTNLILGREIISGADRNSSGAQSKEMRSECVSRYGMMRSLAQYERTEKREAKILSLWLFDELNRISKGKYSSSKMNQLAQHTKLNIQGIVKGDLTKSNATFDLDLSKKYIVILSTPHGASYYTYANELGITRKPETQSMPKRVELYINRLIEDRQTSEKNAYTTVMDELNRSKKKREKALASFKAIAPALQEIATKNRPLASNNSQMNRLKENINKLGAQQRKLEITRDSIKYQINKLEDALK